MYVDISSPKIEEARRQKFHSTVMKLTHVGHRGRKYIQSTTNFLLDRANYCTEQDCGKLRMLIYCVISTMDPSLFLSFDDAGKLMSFIDASFNSREDFKSQTRACSNFSLGMFSSDSSKQKLNTKSLTEAEVVGLSGRLPNITHHQLFVEAHGHPLHSNVVSQDNKSTMLMETNGKASYRKILRYAIIRYFCVKDLVGRK